MTRARTVITVSGLLSLCLAATACTQRWERITPEQLPKPDKEVSALLPKGPQQIQLTQELTGDGHSTITVDGYLDLGRRGDGTDCSMDLAVTDTDEGTAPGEGHLRRFTFRRSPEGPAFSRLEPGSTSIPGVTAGRWYHLGDPDSPRPPLLFSPLYAAGEHGGVKDPEWLCRLALLDNVAHLDPGHPGAVRVDGDRTEVMARYGFERWTEEVLRAGGVQGRRLDRMGRALAGGGMPNYRGLTENQRLTIDPATGNISSSYTKSGKFLVSGHATATARRHVQRPKADTFFDKVRKDPESLGEQVQLPSPSS